MGEVALADEAALEAAVVRTVAAFEAMRRLAPFERAAILDRALALVTARSGELARSIAREAGKPIRDARREAERCAFTLTAARDEARRIGGEVLSLDAFPPGRGHLGLTRRFPLGPALGISPWNFPLNLVAHKIAPALAAGCSILVKPASATPLTALRLGAIFDEAGAPPGAVTVVPCRREIGDRLVADERFRLLSFTGSPEVGWGMKARAGRKRVVLELGGNAAAIVHEDADLDDAVARLVPAAFGYAGQSCISVQRVFVHRKVYARVADALCDGARALRVGDPLDEATDVGPVIDEAAALRLEAWIAQATAAGARVLCGGERCPGGRGTLLSPTLLADVPPGLPVACREVFGPIAVLAPYDDFHEALARVNDSPYGLQAGVFTRDLGRALEAFERLEVGGVLVNQVPTWRIDHMPYGGVKASGLGREGPHYAIDDYTEPRLLVLRF